MAELLGEVSCFITSLFTVQSPAKKINFLTAETDSANETETEQRFK